VGNNRLLALHHGKLNSRTISKGRPHIHDLWHETLADQARHFGPTTRQRAKLVAREFASRLHISVSEAKIVGRNTIRQAGVRLALRVSRKLIGIAEKIEQKAHAIERKR
jgi:hypothetical protein